MALAQESGQKEMGEIDRALFSIRDDKNDINLREQLSERLHPPELFMVGGRDNRDGIRFNRPPESLCEVIQSFKGFDIFFRNRRMNRSLKPRVFSIMASCIE